MAQQTLRDTTVVPALRETPQARERGPRMTLAQREAIFGWLFALPWIIGFTVFTLGPMLFSLYASFTEYNLTSAPEFIGLQNYRQIFTQDAFFWQSLQNTLWMVVFKTPVVIIVALVVAFLLSRNLPGEGFFRAVYYLPNVLAGVAAVFLWRWILAPNGLLNDGLGTVGIDGPNWFTDPNWTKPALIVMGMWWIGGDILILLSGIRGIPKELYEAASIDGADWLQRARFITLPLLTPTMFFILVTSIIGTFQIFTTAYIIIPDNQVVTGGPRGSLLFYVLYLYRVAFGRMGPGGINMGYASALAWILFAIIMAVTLVQLRLANRWVYYESEE